MPTIYTILFIIIFLSFSLSTLYYAYYLFLCIRYIKKHFPDYHPNLTRYDVALLNMKGYREYMQKKGVTAETITIKRYLFRLRLSILLVLIDIILMAVLVHLSHITQS